ncbi:MAG TPA: hypothetical protein VNT30_06010 [Stellaceae bacterium]|nr:hypothetical protein [Stellaceae bacterium]
MNIVHGGRMAFTERNNPRGGTFHYKRLVEGISGTPGNFGLMLSRTYDNFDSPRHHHNFEQIRFQLEGTCSFGRDGDMVPGTIGYFPEGAFYGPQSAEGAALVLVLQFGGPSGSGYMSEDDLQRSVAELSKVGEFRAGVFHRSTGEGRKRQDAYEAAWENLNDRPLVYPKPLYPAPVLARDDTVAWQDTAAGLRTKPFGRFHGGTTVSVLTLAAGASHAVSGACILFVISGEGRIGDEPVEAHASLHLEAGETAALSAGAGLEVLVIELPRIEARAAARTMAA